MNTFEKQAAPALVLARVRIHNMEVTHIWRAGARNLPEGFRLNTAMSRPFMNFREGRIQLAELLGVEDPTKVKFEAHRGSRTFYFSPKPHIRRAQYEALLVPIGD